MWASVCLRAYGCNLCPCRSMFVTNPYFLCKEISALFFSCIPVEKKIYNKIEAVKIWSDFYCSPFPPPDHPRRRVWPSSPPPQWSWNARRWRWMPLRRSSVLSRSSWFRPAPRLRPSKQSPRCRRTPSRKPSTRSGVSGRRRWPRCRPSWKVTAEQNDEHINNNNWLSVMLILKLKTCVD